MKIALLGKVVDAFHKSYLGKDGTEKESFTITVMDEDAFFDNDRYFPVFVSSEVMGSIKPESLIGKSVSLNGVLTKYEGKLQFRPEQVKIVESKSE